MNLQENIDLFHRFHLRAKSNNILYFEDGWYYNYTGKAQSRELIGVIEEKAYLMYDRRSYLEPGFLSKGYRLVRRYAGYLGIDDGK